MAKYKKSDYQKFKERVKLPWSPKTLTDFWLKLMNPTPRREDDPMKQIMLRMRHNK